MKEIMILWHNVFGPAGSEYAKWVRRHSICPLIGSILGLITGLALVVWLILSLVGCGAVTDEDASAVPEATTEITVTQAPVLESREPLASRPVPTETKKPDGRVTLDNGITIVIPKATQAPVLESREPLASKPAQAEDRDGTVTLDNGLTIVVPQATEKPAGTTDKPAATSRPAAKVPYSETEIETEYGRLVKAGDWYLFDFGTEIASGFGMDGLSIHHEAYYGVKAETDGTVVTYEIYDHTEEDHPVKAVAVKRIETDKNARLDIPETGETADFDLDREPDGMYVLIVKYESGEYCWVAFYKEDATVHAVQAWKLQYDTENTRNRAIEMAERAERTAVLVEEYGFTPEGIMDGEAFVFPRASLDESDKWRELAHDIVPDDTLPDSVKALMVYDWMSENMKYDYYKSDVLGAGDAAIARDRYYNDFSGTWSIYNTRTGVCRDFAGIANVMLRELGIPSVFIATKGHQCNLVWIDGQWESFDVTANTEAHAVWGEDINDVRENEIGTDRYDNFMPFRDKHLDKVKLIDVYTHHSAHCC